MISIIMFSYIFLLISTFFVIFRQNISNKNNTIIYSYLFSSALFSYTVLGQISLVLTLLNLTRFPIIVISFFTLLICSISNKNYKKINNLFTFFKCELNNFVVYINSNKERKYIFFICLILTFFICLSSVGPINHPDASDYHVGYPYQYFLRGGFFVDGGLHQGLLGIGDYANLAFLQENNIWLIRSIQIITLPLIFFFFGSQKKVNIFLIALLSSPIFIQWSTIGKPLFLGESSVGITYLIWQEKKDLNSLKFLLLCIISCLSIKISSLLISLPILFEICFFYKNIFYVKKTFSKYLLYLCKSKLIIISLSIFFSILFSRYLITNNFFYPLLTNIFNPEEQLVTKFAESLSSYQRNNGFPLNIFIPISFSGLSSTLGLSVFLIFILLIFYDRKPFNRFLQDSKINTATLQTLLLIAFCQGRGDYYACPLIIFIFSSEKLSKLLNKRLLKFAFLLTLVTQISCLLLISTISFSQSVIAIFNYDYLMNNTAYGYFSSKELNKESGEVTLHNIGRDTRLFYPVNYVDNDFMKSCLLENKFNSDPQQKCLSDNNITKIISYPNYLVNKDNYKCNYKDSYIATRNPFNSRKSLIEICYLKNNL